jgi:hypothetical protein
MQNMGEHIITFWTECNILRMHYSTCQQQVLDPLIHQSCHHFCQQHCDLLKSADTEGCVGPHYKMVSRTVQSQSNSLPSKLIIYDTNTRKSSINNAISWLLLFWQKLHHLHVYKSTCNKLPPTLSTKTHNTWTRSNWSRINLMLVYNGGTYNDIPCIEF